MFAKSDVKVISANSTYIVTSNIEMALSSESRRVFLCDENVKARARQFIGEESPWIFVQASEELKTLEICAAILEEMAGKGVNRDYELVAIGGGVVQDIATLVASLYMRGINWVYVPTTLMAMMDSCIGGKSSINVGPYKNLVGNFYAPSSIYIDPTFTSTLSQEDISCGIAEGGKICFAADLESFARFTSLIEEWRSVGSVEDLHEAIFLALNCKKWFIEIDEFDRKERKLLNFGHSFGHALEAATSFNVPHGIAILIGMKAALIHAETETSLVELSNFINAEIAASGFASKKLSFSESLFLTALEKDKKNSSVLLNLILPRNTGELAVKSFPLNEQSLRECFRSIRSALKELGIAHEVL